MEEYNTLGSKAFTLQKKQCLSKVDFSRKGSVDEPVKELVTFLNEQPDCFTTSSCSGRIIVVDNTDEQGGIKKQGCQWLYVTHDEANWEDIISSLACSMGEAVLKFEAMVMHIQVSTIKTAQLLHSVAVASGFRNSGISIGGKGKIIVAVRSTHSLEAPLTSQGQRLVQDQYIKYLVTSSNRKREENVIRIDRFYKNIISAFQNREITSSQAEERSTKKIKEKQTRREDLEHGSKNCDSVKQMVGCDTSSGLEDSFDSLLFEET